MDELTGIYYEYVDIYENLNIIYKTNRIKSSRSVQNLEIKARWKFNLFRQLETKQSPSRYSFKSINVGNKNLYDSIRPNSNNNDTIDNNDQDKVIVNKRKKNDDLLTSFVKKKFE